MENSNELNIEKITKEFNLLEAKHREIKHKIKSLENEQDTIERERIELYFKLSSVCPNRLEELCKLKNHSYKKLSHYAYDMNICNKYCPKLRF